MAEPGFRLWYPSLSQSNPKMPVIVRLCGWQQTCPFHYYGPTVRDYYLLHYIISGKGKFTVDNNTYSLSAGDGFVIAPGVLTYYISDDYDPWEYWWVGWDGEFAKNALDDIDFTIPQKIFHYPDVDHLFREFQKLADAFETKSNGYKVLPCFYSIISNIVNDDFTTMIRKDNTYISNAISFIKINYPYEIDVKIIAKETGSSVSNLYRLFKNYLNTSIKKYLNNYRMEKAIELMYTSNMNITEIALACGFGGGAYFSNLFKHNTGKSPYSYRKEIKQSSTPPPPPRSFYNSNSHLI